MQKWQCTVCGYIHVGSEAPENCPVCGSDSSLFASFEPQGVPASTAGEKVGAQFKAQAQPASQQWHCAVCGYVHTGISAPLACPVCGADQDRYAVVDPSTPPPAKEIEKEPAFAKAPRSYSSLPEKEASTAENHSRLEWVLDKMVDLHAHPIAVHIPNGVLPMAVIFLLLGILFDSHSLSMVAFYNLIFIALAMPIVLFSGYNDWQRRFGGHLTNVFLTKMICGGVVLIGTFSGVIWRLFDPEVILPSASGRWSYLLLHMVVLAAAIVAGFCGGKLIIFPQKQRSGQ